MATERDLTPEELELIDLALAEKAREIGRAKYHDFGPSGKTTHTYVRPIRRKGDKKALFRLEWVHRFIKSKARNLSIFPESKDWDVMCTGPGENMCYVCWAVQKIYEYAQKLEEKGRTKRSKELMRVAKSAKAKQMRHWVGITYDKTGEVKGIEPYRYSEWFFKQDLNKILIEKKFTISQWIRKHPDLKKMTDAKQEEHYLRNCPPKRALPDDPKGGWKIFISKSGAGTDTEYEAKYEEDAPLSKGSEEVGAIKEAVNAGTYPDLDAMLAKMSYDEMKAALGAMNKDLVGGHIPSDDSEDEEEVDEGPEDELDEEPEGDEEESEEEEEDEEEDDEDDADEEDEGEDEEEDDGEDADEDEEEDEESDDDSEEDAEEGDEDDEGDDDSGDDDEDDDEAEEEEPPKKSTRKRASAKSVVAKAKAKAKSGKKKKKASDDEDWEDIPF